METTADLLARQAGVISRVQALDAELTPNDVRRLLRRRVWVTAHPGVYVNHTGELTWKQRALAAVLFAWPAALSHESALVTEQARRTEPRGSVIHLAVGRDRRLRTPPGVRIHRTSHLEERVNWNLWPPRVRLEEAVLDVAAACTDDLAALDALASAVQSRRTTAKRLQAALANRAHSRRRAWMTGILEDVAAGACSVLEHGYLTRVERPHGLPVARRQVPAVASRGRVYRDVEYGNAVVELDGRLFHDSSRQRDRDLDRDLDVAVEGRTSLRLGYGQVFERPCLTASRVAAVLAARGWTGTPHRCGPTCPVGGAQVSPGDIHAPPTPLLT